MTKLVTKHTKAGESGKLITCPHCQAQDRVYHFSWVTLVCNACKTPVQKLDWIAETYRKRPTVTIKQAWNWLGDRGMFIPKSNIKVRGRWALVRTRYEWEDGWDDEIDCYDVLSGSMYAEPWSDIKYCDSPFIPRNEERTEIALTKMEQTYEEDNNETWQGNGLCLIALSGDCANGGMGSANTVLPFRKEHHGMVKDLLEAQLAFHMYCAFSNDSGSPEAQKKVVALFKSTNALRDAGVFHHKYHERTTWELTHMADLDYVARYKPFQVVYPEPQTEREA